MRREEDGPLPSKKTPMMPASYEEHEIQLVRDLIYEYEHSIGEERSAALNSIFTLHELKALLDASVLEEVEEKPEEKNLPERKPVTPVDPRTMEIPF